MLKVVVRRIIDPSLYWNSVVWSIFRMRTFSVLKINSLRMRLTLMKHVTERAVVQYDNFAQVRLHRA